MVQWVTKAYNLEPLDSASATLHPIALTCSTFKYNSYQITNRLFFSAKWPPKNQITVQQFCLLSSLFRFCGDFNYSNSSRKLKLTSSTQKKGDLVRGSKLTNSFCYREGKFESERRRLKTSCEVRREVCGWWCRETIKELRRTSKDSRVPVCVVGGQDPGRKWPEKSFSPSIHSSIHPEAGHVTRIRSRETSLRRPHTQGFKWMAHDAL